MLKCTCPVVMACPAIGSNFDCFPWCDFLKDSETKGVCMKVPIHIAKGGKLEPAGYAEVEVFDAEALWHLCNWSCYQEEKPDNLFSEIEYCGHGICFTNPETDQKWLALSFDWYVTDNMREIEKYVTQNEGKHVWRKVD